jgi:copper(I)-binding protein
MKRFASLRRVALGVLYSTFGVGIIVLLAAAAFGASSSAISIHDAYSRPATDMGAVFLTIENASASDEQLDDARSTVANATEVHETYVVAGGDAMRHIPSLTIPAGKSVTLKPGGYHIMLIGLRGELHPGDHFTIGLHFHGAGWIDVPVVVRNF